MFKQFRVFSLILVGFVLVGTGGGLSMAGAESSWSLKMTVPLEFGISTVDMDRMIKFYTEVLEGATCADCLLAYGLVLQGHRMVHKSELTAEKV